MPIIDIDGVGQVEFPDDMSDDEISSAIQSNLPKWEEGTKNRQFAKDFAKGGKLMMSPAALMSVAKGVPVLGNLLNNILPAPMREIQDEIESEHPIQSGALRTGGAVASTLPLAVATGGMSVPAQMGINAPTMAALGVADKFAEKGKDTTYDDVKHSAIINFLMGLAGPALSKVLSPTAKVAPKAIPAKPPLDISTPPIDAKTLAHLKSSMTPEDFAKITTSGKPGFVSPGQSREMLETSLNKSRMAANETKNAAQAAEHKAQIDALKSNVPSWLENAPSHVAGGIVGHMVGGPMGMVAGGLAGPAIKAGLEKAVPAYWGNQLMSSPANRAFLNAVMGSQGINY